MSKLYPNSNYFNSCIELQTKQELDDSKEISTDSNLISELAEQIKSMGIIEPFSDKYQAVLNDPENSLTNNLREGLQTQTSISRTRLMMYLLQDKLDLNKSRIFIPESVTPFAKWAVNNLEAELFCSEFKRQTSFADSDFQGIALRFENLENLTYKDNFFDLALVNDVYEHVSSFENALKETYRVLKKDGILLASFPIDLSSEKTLILAENINEKIIYHSEPVYHDDPLNPEIGSLCYRIFGWDVIKQCSDIGFKKSFFVFVSSLKHGIIGNDMTHCVALQSIK